MNVKAKWPFSGRRRPVEDLATEAEMQLGRCCATAPPAAKSSPLSSRRRRSSPARERSARSSCSTRRGCCATAPRPIFRRDYLDAIDRLKPDPGVGTWPPRRLRASSSSRRISAPTTSGRSCATCRIAGLRRRLEHADQVTGGKGPRHVRDLLPRARTPTARDRCDEYAWPPQRPWQSARRSQQPLALRSRLAPDSSCVRAGFATIVVGLRASFGLFAFPAVPRCSPPPSSPLRSPLHLHLNHAPSTLFTPGVSRVRLYASPSLRSTSAASDTGTPSRKARQAQALRHRQAHLPDHLARVRRHDRRADDPVRPLLHEHPTNPSASPSSTARSTVCQSAARTCRSRSPVPSASAADSPTCATSGDV